jgi:hypothetical protein
MTATISKNQTDVPGVLLVLNDVVEGSEEEFNRWYQQQHVPERLAVKGFRTARRYHVVDGQPAYMAVYECDSIDVFASKTYQECLANPTDWTRKVMPSFRNMLRSACRETWSVGAGVGGGAIIVQCKPVPGREDLARRFVKDKLAPDIMQSASLVRMSLWEADASFTGGPSPEMALRGGSDKSADWVLFLESYDLTKSASAIDTQVLAGTAREAGLLLDSWTKYRLMHARCRDNLRSGVAGNLAKETHD